jgi:hypothetical protein
MTETKITLMEGEENDVYRIQGYRTYAALSFRP